MREMCLQTTVFFSLLREKYEKRKVSGFPPPFISYNKVMKALFTIHRDTDNNSATKGDNERSFGFVHQHFGDDIT